MLNDRRIVLIASEAVLTAWSARAAPAGEVIEMSDADVPGALAALMHHQPHMVVLEESFTLTERGVALVRRLQVDPTFRQTEIRLLSPERVASIGRAGAGLSLAALTHPVSHQYGMARRYARWTVTVPVKAEMNGHGVTLIDLSTNGAQLLSPMIVRPTQRVRILFEHLVRITAKVVWVAFEMSTSAEPRYRTGIEFLDADCNELHALFLRLRLPVVTPTQS